MPLLIAVRVRFFYLLPNLKISSINTGVIMSKIELAYLLNEANTLLDEIEVTIENMFADAIESNKNKYAPVVQW